jgi:hypothetical protein
MSAAWGICFGITRRIFAGDAMTELFESVALGFLVEGDVPCPFCVSESDNQSVTKVMTNDSRELAQNLGGMPTNTMRLKGDYEVVEKYFITDEISQLGLNAHHVIPGNASLGECPEILQWMAGTTTIKKKIYDKPINAKVKSIKNAALKDQLRAKLVSEKAEYQNTVLYGDPDMLVTFSTVPGRAAIHRDKTVSENLVKGEITYDINDSRNGVWLPSNNAIVGWSDMASSEFKAIDFNGKNRSFHEAYAYNSMFITQKQFHDAHENYSAEVVFKLRQIASQLNKLGNDCLMHQNTPSEKNSYPAPERLTGALYILARHIISEKLDLKTACQPSSPWITSRLSEQVAPIPKRTIKSV